MDLSEARTIKGLGNAQRLARRLYGSPENIRHNGAYASQIEIGLGPQPMGPAASLARAEGPPSVKS